MQRPPLRVLVLATTTGYQTRSFAEAAERLHIDLRLATDRCHMLDDPWRDAAIPIRFHEEDEAAGAILRASAETPFDGVVAVGDRPTVIAAMAAQAFGIPGHPPDAARVSRSKLHTRERLAAAGLPVPWFRTIGIDDDLSTVLSSVRFPCVVKPLSLSGSRGVIRADDERTFRDAFGRVQRLLLQKDVRALRDPLTTSILVEGFIAGTEFALEGVLERGQLQVLALFDKPDPLDGPFFEETIYVTPSGWPDSARQLIVEAVANAARALGLWHGPIHAECRVNDHGIYVLEVAARPIGGLCAKALRFESGTDALISLEELLLRHAIGESVAAYRREPDASSVMMMPIPKGGYLKGVEGLDEARAVEGIAEIHITAKADQRLLPLPEGSSYLGFVFARADSPAGAVAAIRAAHAKLQFTIDPALPVV